MFNVNSWIYLWRLIFSSTSSKFYLFTSSNLCLYSNKSLEFWSFWYYCIMISRLSPSNLASSPFLNSSKSYLVLCSSFSNYNLMLDNILISSFNLSVSFVRKLTSSLKFLISWLAKNASSIAFLSSLLISLIVFYYYNN